MVVFRISLLCKETLAKKAPLPPFPEKGAGTTAKLTLAGAGTDGKAV